MGLLDTENEVDDLFDELHDRLAKDVSIFTQTTPWNRAIRGFKLQLASQLPTTPPAPSPQTTPERETAFPARPKRVPESKRAAVESDERITISNISLAPQDNKMYGEATNNESVMNTVYIQATFYGAEGNIVATRDTVVPQLWAGATKTFSIDRIPDHHRYKVEIKMAVGR